MKPEHRRAYLWLLLAVFLVDSTRADMAQGRRAAVATVHPIATQAALDTFRRGGNAIDAAVAAGLTLGVVDGHNSGIGGGCVMTVRLANGRMVCIDGREVAPLLAGPGMFVRNSQPQPQLAQSSPLAVAVPGALMAYGYANDLYGRLPFSEHLQYAARIAESGFPIDPNYARKLAAAADELRLYNASRETFLRPDGSPLQVNQILRQPRLAETYRAIAAQGVGWFYNGPFAVATGLWMSTNGGILSPADFALYQIRVRQPIRTTYRGYTILGFPPPSSGGVHVAQILNILEKFDLRSMGLNSPDAVHVISQAMKLAFADRAHWLGDPEFTRVPRGLISKEYAATLALRIQMESAVTVPAYGTPPQAERNAFDRHTTHFSTADAAGNWVACTATINTSFGSKIVIPGTGVLLNNQMDDFAIQPGVTNFFGLLGADANAIAPRKRPLTSMSPTIVLRNGRPILAIGAAGGPTIISQTVLAIIHRIDFDLDIQAALAQPRFHHQWFPDELRVERSMNPEVIEALEQRGHKITLVDSIGATQAVGLEPGEPGMISVTDPRVDGRAGAF